MRTCAVLFLMAFCARAETWEALKKTLEEERFGEALQMADAALVDHGKDGVLLWLRAKAVVGVARDLQRERGYPAALDFLERHLDHEWSAFWYGRTCGWAGEEERGIAALRRSDLPEPHRLHPELGLLLLLRRYEEVVARAAEVGGEDSAEWIEWAGEQAALRDRLAGRARLSLVVSLVVIGAAVAGLVVTLSRASAT